MVGTFDVGSITQGTMTPAEITSIVGSILGVTPEDIRQKTRKYRNDRVVFARCAAISLCRSNTSLTLSRLAKYYGLKNHATVLNAVRTCQNMVETNRFFSQFFTLIHTNINKSEFERLQLTEFIPFVYSLETPQNEQNN